MDSSLNSDTGSNSDSNGGAGSEVCVTLDSLSLDGQSPQVGDHVDLQGTVSRIEGTNAYVKVDNSMDDSGSADDGSMLRQNAQSLDQQTPY